MCTGLCLSTSGCALGAVAVVVLLLMVWAFVANFCAPIQRVGDDHDTSTMDQQIKRWIQFAYWFTFAAVAASVLAFVWPQPRIVMGAPMHILVGCVHGTDAAESIQCGELSTTDPKPAQACQARPAHGQWLITIGGLVSPRGVVIDCNPPEPSATSRDFLHTYEVEGGLVVPLSVVFVSLVGGAISLTRRVPEYQKRLSPNYVGTEAEPKLSAEQGREYLVFQIVQFVSAPFLAVVAYQMFDPSTPAATVTMAFATGFASESILLLIRALIEKLAPAALNKIALGAIAGCVTDGNGKPLAAAKLAAIGDTDIHTETDALGQFVLDGVAAGRRTVEVEAAGGSTAVIVTVAAGKTTLCNISAKPAPAGGAPALMAGADVGHDGCCGPIINPTPDHELPAAQGGVANHE